MATQEHLSEDIIRVRILPRLPVKSLLRFKCVSKKWYTLISSPKFANSHFKLTSEQESLNPRVLFYINGSGFKSLEVKTPSFGGVVAKPTCPFKQPDKVFLIGSCNGLVCLCLTFYDEQHWKFYIWNPTTGFFKKLPEPDFGPERINCLYCCGFGYLSAADDYKVFVCAGSWDWNSETEEPTLMFSYRANSWKRIQSNRHKEVEAAGALSNEALHWVLDNCILAFDLAQEDYREIPFPAYENEADNAVDFQGLWVLSGGSLGIKGVKSDCVEFWVMTEYGVRASWTKFVKFLVNEANNIKSLHPVYVERGIVVGHFDEDLLVRFDQRVGMHDSNVVRTSQYSLEHLSSGVINFDETLLDLNDKKTRQDAALQIPSNVPDSDVPTKETPPQDPATAEFVPGGDKDMHDTIVSSMVHCSELSSESGHGQQLFVSDLEVELCEMRLSFIMEIEKRKQAEESLNNMRSQWQRIREQLSLVGLTLPEDPAPATGHEQLGSDPAEDLCQQVYIARFVSNSVGRGLIRAEMEMEMEAHIESKNFEIARLVDKLRNYEVMNQKMVQKNEDALEMARRNRERRERRQRWVWGSIATALTLGTAALAYSYIPSSRGWPTIDSEVSESGDAGK